MRFHPLLVGPYISVVGETRVGRPYGSRQRRLGSPMVACHCTLASGDAIAPIRSCYQNRYGVPTARGKVVLSPGVRTGSLL